MLRRTIQFAVGALILCNIALVAAVSPPAAVEFVRPKSAQVVSPIAKAYMLRHAQADTVLAWVFFTDKGIFNGSELQTAKRAHAGFLTSRAVARRAKSGVDELKYTDLPVVDSYVSEIVAQGVSVRHVSRWLNAASVRVDIKDVDRISALPFVARIQPVAIYHNDYSAPDVPSKQTPQETAQGDHLLSYGNCYAQLQQIDVPICHDSGYYGQGVIISVFDSGFRKSHVAFAQAYAEGRVLAEWDFVFNDGNVANQGGETSAWDHGTSTWSICGGEYPGKLYGPSYGASFILCKTEDVRSETQVEEDNWEAAMEWVDSIGTDIITSSLTYTDWYTYEDYDGNTCVTTIAADIAAANGIIVCNSAGNYGPNLHTIGAPADADSILTVGSVNSSSVISDFSSKGPTYDGRIKPEVCALGENNYRAIASSDIIFGTGANGTSFSCPMVAGAAGVVLSAHPDWSNMQVRQALMKTASQGYSPNHTYGWGIIDTWAAIHYVSVNPPGDADRNGLVNVSDAVFLVNYVFAGGTPPEPVNAGDANDSGAVNVSDVVYLINFIFGGGPAPKVF